MKRQFQDIGVKKWYGDHLLDMQDELYTLLDTFFSNYGAHVVYGCKIQDNGDSWTIGNGLVSLPFNGAFRVCRFETIEIADGEEAYFSVDVRDHLGAYKDGSQKAIAKEYVAKKVLTPTDALTIKKDGTHHIFDALVQQKAYEEAKSKEPAFEKNSGFNLNKSSAIDSDKEDELATSKAIKEVKEIAEEKESALPAGAIIMWAGALADIPQGWRLCDGSNGTPDLRGRFVVGYHSGDTDYNSLKKTGGLKSVTLLSTQIPKHTHPLTIDDNGGGHSHVIQGRLRGGGSGSPNIHVNSSTDNGNWADTISGREMLRTNSSGFHTHTGSVGQQSSGGSSHENRPPYLVLAYIMKM
ncbi:tail fiber protein [Persicobacter sp. CCB-QB2]|uniref:tail fiber protein n=1 Tax=Persicobacter sp. CCB-QB2 TaxID=1561025 RepID=UPI0006A999EC|nr:tail fiber protein [Persicobacter sp. CCB-QB2]